MRCKCSKSGVQFHSKCTIYTRSTAGFSLRFESDRLTVAGLRKHVLDCIKYPARNCSLSQEILFVLHYNLQSLRGNKSLAIAAEIASKCKIPHALNISQRNHMHV